LSDGVFADRVGALGPTVIASEVFSPGT
jgi:hypothetical protein